MNLDYLHRLTLHGRTTSNSIVLDPDSAGIRINGQQVITPGNAGIQLGTAFVGKSAAGVNLALPGATLRSQSGLPPQLLLGAQNDSRTNDNTSGVLTDHTQGVLIVGSGTQPPSNGLRILDDGTVLIRPKGNLQMATEFRAGPTP